VPGFRIVSVFSRCRYHSVATAVSANRLRVDERRENGRGCAQSRNSDGGRGAEKQAQSRCRIDMQRFIGLLVSGHAMHDACRHGRKSSAAGPHRPGAPAVRSPDVPRRGHPSLPKTLCAPRSHPVQLQSFLGRVFQAPGHSRSVLACTPWVLESQSFSVL
jgi:hypothetical protein